MESKSIYGASAKVYITYEFTLSDLVQKIAKGLGINTFRVDNEINEPYESVAYAEVMGFEIELKEIVNNKNWPGYNFIMSFVTTDSFEEIANNRMYDLSYWMARYISLECDTTTLAENIDKKTALSFSRDSVTKTREIRMVIAN